jgi:hypothetical protein
MNGWKKFPYKQNPRESWVARLISHKTGRKEKTVLRDKKDIVH